MAVWKRRHRNAYCARCNVWVAPDSEFFGDDGWMICEPNCPGPSRWESKPAPVLLHETPIYDQLTAERHG